MEKKELEKISEEIKTQMEGVASEIKNLLDSQKEEIKKNGETTIEIKTDLDKLNASQDELKAQMIELQRLGEEGGSGDKEDMSFGFKHFGEFMIEAMDNRKSNPNDDRFKKLNDFEMEVYGSGHKPGKGFMMPPAFRSHPGVTMSPEQLKELSFGVGAEGGFFVPTQTGPMVKMFEPQPGIFRPRATVIPAGSPPDAPIQLPALDQSGSTGVYAGVEVVWINEGVTKSETDFEVRQIKLEPQEVAGYITITDKLLRNAPALGVLAQNLLRRAIIAAEDNAFMNGSGAGQPLGLEGHASVILQPRFALNQVNYVDIVNMYSQIVFGGSYVWIVSQTVLPQLMNMQDGGGHLIWMPNKDAMSTMPGTLLGIPIVINNRSPILGVQGDIMLCDLSYYYIKDGSGIFVASSEHVEFKKNKTLIKAFWNVMVNRPLLHR